MQIFKASLLTCAFTLALGTVPLHAADTAAQAAARAALKEKMRELAPPTAAAEAPAVVTPPAPATVAETPAAAAPAAFVLPEGASPDLIEQAREANRAARAELERQKNAATADKHKKAAPAPVEHRAVKAPSAPEKKAAPAMADTAPAQSPPEKNSNPDLVEQARQATRARMAELQSHKKTAIPAGREAPIIQPANSPAAENITATEAVTTQVKAAAPTTAELRAAKAREAAEKKAEQAKMAKAKAQAEADKKARAAADAKARVAATNATKPAEPAKPAKPAKKAKPEPAKVDATVTLAPMEGPASSLPATKDQALRALLDQYKAEKISAEEYHQQRSKILAEP